jgi:hypothetical protein
MRCPVCRAENAEPTSCRRCKADLSLLCQLEGRRARVLALARRHLAAGVWQDAAVEATEADRLRHGSDAHQLTAVACLLGGDFAGAWAEYRAATRMRPDPAGP